MSTYQAGPSPGAAKKEACDDMPVAILNRNKPVGYLISAKAWEAICNQLEGIELRRIAKERLKDGRKMIKVAVDDL
jgi:antitoxin StbD